MTLEVLAFVPHSIARRMGECGRERVVEFSTGRMMHQPAAFYAALAARERRG